MMKFLLLPFRVVFYLLRAIFFPWYLRWIFRLHWVIYFGFAFGVGYLAYQEYQTYLFNRLEAELQITDGPPDVIPLSKWSAADNAPYNDEVSIRGIYFAALDQGEFDPIGLKRQFILLADDQGREVKAALVVGPQDMAQLQRQLAAQGSGDRIVVTVNGSLSTNSEWERMIGTELVVMNVPRAQDLVIIEPFIGDRAVAITDRAEKTSGTVEVFGALAGLLALFGAVKFLSGGTRDRVKTPSKVNANAQRKQKPVQTPPPEASPWGKFQPITTPPDAQPKSATKAQKPARASQKPRTAAQTDALPPLPAFKSVFAGGGDSFRFKSADQIILQSFGTLSTLTARKHDK
ncbi:MAG: hypothetical protein ACSHXW_20250 [Yoonia sp.]